MAYTLEEIEEKLNRGLVLLQADNFKCVCCKLPQDRVNLFIPSVKVIDHMDLLDFAVFVNDNNGVLKGRGEL